MGIHPFSISGPLSYGGSLGYPRSIHGREPPHEYEASRLWQSEDLDWDAVLLVLQRETWYSYVSKLENKWFNETWC